MTDSVQNPAPARASVTWRLGAGLVIPLAALASQGFLAAQLSQRLPPFLFSVPAVLVTAWYFGRPSGLLATVVALLGAWHLFLSPEHVFFPIDLGDAVIVGVFAFTALAISVLLPGLRSQLAKTARMAGALKASEERLRFHLENSPLALVEWDSSFIVTRWAGRAEQMFGWSAVETVGKSITDLNLIHPDDIAVVQETMHKLKGPGEAAVVSLNRNLAKDGRVIHCTWYNSALRGPTGDIISILSQVEDRTKRVEIEAAQKSSDQKLRLFVEHAPAAIAMLDTELRYIAVSRRWAAIVGIGPEELIGRSHYDVFPDLPDRWKELHRKCLAGGVERRDEDYWPRADGTTQWLRWEIRPWYSDERKIGGLMVFSEDLTALKQAEVSLRGNAEQLSLAMSASKAGFWESDPKTGINRWSSELFQLFGFDPKAGAPSFQEWRNIVHPDDRPGTEAILAEAVRTSSEFSVEYRVEIPGGGRRWILGRGRPVRNAAGEVGHFAGILMDVTALKETERKLADAVALRDEFLSIASHELKTPLTALALQFELAQRDLKRAAGADAARESSLFKTMLNSTKQIRRLSALINDLLDVSRIQSGRLTLNPEPLKVGELVSEVVDRMVPGLVDAGCKIKTQLPSGENDREAFWDRVRVEQILTNLLSNASKYAAGSNVEIEARPQGENVMISVTDSGPGIPKENQLQIFERFERVTSTRAITGLGLGLYIVRQIAQAHGGSVYVRSEPGHGARFVVNLPLRVGARAQSGQMESAQ